MRIYKKIFMIYLKIELQLKFWFGKKDKIKKRNFFPSTRLNKFKNNKIKFETSQYKYCVIVEPVRMFNINFFKINSPLKEMIELVKFLKIIKEKVL